MRYLFTLLCVCALSLTPVVGCGEEASEPPEDCAGQGRWECHTSVWDPEWGCHEPDGTECCVERDCCTPCGYLCLPAVCQLCCYERGECIDGSCR